jgi:hypothetical protein
VPVPLKPFQVFASGGGDGPVGRENPTKTPETTTVERGERTDRPASTIM